MNIYRQVCNVVGHRWDKPPENWRRACVRCGTTRVGYREGEVPFSIPKKLEEGAMAGYSYLAWEVDRETYDAADIGSKHEGGVVVDGICDGDRNALVIITRHGGNDG